MGQMCPNLIKPYSSRGLNYRKKIFNYRLSLARRFVESAFGILCAKWRILTTCIQMNPDTVDDVVKACIILHNHVLHKEPLLMEEQDMVHNLSSVITSGRRSRYTRCVTIFQNILYQLQDGWIGKKNTGEPGKFWPSGSELMLVFFSFFFRFLVAILFCQTVCPHYYNSKVSI